MKKTTTTVPVYPAMPSVVLSSTFFSPLSLSLSLSSLPCRYCFFSPGKQRSSRLPAQDGAAPADRHAAASLTRGHLKVLLVDLLDVVKLLVVLRVLVALGLGGALLLHAGLGLRGSRTVLGGAQAQQISVMSAPGNLPIDSAKKAGEGNAENGCVGACSHVRVYE